jgi:hypothetical protein
MVFCSVLDPHLDKGPPTRIVGRKRSDRLPLVKAVAKRRETAKQTDDSTDHSDRRGPHLRWLSFPSPPSREVVSGRRLASRGDRKDKGGCFPHYSSKYHWPNLNFERPWNKPTLCTFTGIGARGRKMLTILAILSGPILVATIVMIIVFEIRDAWHRIGLR